MLVEAWPRRSVSWSDWNKLRIRIQTARNIVRNFYQKNVHEPDSNLMELLDDLNILYGVAVIRGIEFEQAPSPREAA